MHKLIIIIVLLSISHTSHGTCWEGDKSYYVARPTHLAGLLRIKKLPISNTRKDFLNKMFGEYNWDTINKNIFIKTPSWAENNAAVPISVELLKPLSNTGAIYLFAEYRVNSDFQYEKLAKINFKREIMSFASRFNMPATAKIFVVLHDNARERYHISADYKVNGNSFCSGISVETQKEADKYNRNLCNNDPTSNACSRLK